jgi:inner membrane protein
VLFGRAVAWAAPARAAGPGVTAALVLGSIAPDADAALALRGFDVYLGVHAAGTHSLAGTAIVAAALALGLRRLVRGSRFGPLFFASLAGTLGHVFWDLADGGDIRLFAPLSSAVSGWHLVTMGEPVVLLILAAAAIAGWRRPMRARAAARAAFVGLAALLTVKTASEARALQIHAAAAGSAHPAVVAPVMGSLFRWSVYDRDGETIRGWTVDVRRRTAAVAFSFRDLADSPAAALSRDLPVVRTFFSFSILPFARIERDGAVRRVWWSDASRCSARGCDLAFGGTFDSADVPIAELIRIGGFTERRTLAARVSPAARAPR